MLTRIILGLQRHPIRVVVEAGIAFAALWTALEATQSFLQFTLIGGAKFGVLLGISLVVGVFRALPTNKRSAIIPGTSARLTITYGNLFHERGVIAVPVNEYFDCLMGDHVSPNSVHGQAIAILFHGDARRFERAVRDALANVGGESVIRSSGLQVKYPIGTTAFLATGAPSVLAFALATTDVTNLKVSADVTQMWRALHGLWENARVHCNDSVLSVPLVGGGLSGVMLAPQQLLALIVMSLSSETRRQRICGHIRICLLEDVREKTDIDLAFQLLS